jgi:hypothetical protein
MNKLDKFDRSKVVKHCPEYQVVRKVVEILVEKLLNKKIVIVSFFMHCKNALNTVIS